ncbi:cyclic nucleotide-binding domain-containing protein [bacterium]|nr:cyclic nucleotide-binding domain-containing protein [bacterium]
METTAARAVVERVIPFAFLDGSRRAWVASRLTEQRYEPHELVQQVSGDTVFLIARGSIEVVEVTPAGTRVRQTITEGHYFGERTALLEAAPERDVRAGEEGCDLFALAGADFLSLVSESVVFSQALASILVQKQKIFEPYKRLEAKLLEVMSRGSFLLSEVLPYYQALHPALHAKLTSHELDLDALAYAVPRLPPEVTTTTFYFLTDTIPHLYSDPDAKFAKVNSGKQRRRSLWQLMPGKLLVLLRDGMTDVTDLLTCLCLYATEVRKLRRRIGTDTLLRWLAKLSGWPDPLDEQRMLAELPLSEDERAGILRIWPQKTSERLREVLVHHEDIAFQVRRSLDDYNSRASEDWVSQIRETAARVVDMDSDFDVHVISSNTHSVGNCLSPYLARRSGEILEWGREHLPDGFAGDPGAARPWGERWASRADLVYATAPAFFAANPDAARERDEVESATGRIHLSQTAFTGIQVDLIDARRLRDDATDPDVPIRVPERPTLIVNIDYAFGEQADEILANLIYVFGRRIRSVNVLGKAGALAGKRGDLLLPRATLLQTNDELYPLPNNDLSRADLAALAEGRSVQEGPILTIAGTLLQDRPLLLFYKKVWRCVGLEMEGSFYARRVVASIATGVLEAGVVTRFAYYVSDAPLEPSSTLVEALRPEEGIPPLYAITRAMLRRIFA